MRAAIEAACSRKNVGGFLGALAIGDCGEQEAHGFNGGQPACLIGQRLEVLECADAGATEFGAQV
jgi:hypothetical protein